jgi:hypothetical protein
MQYVLGNMLNGGGINPDGLSLDLQFAADKTLTARRGPTPVFTRGSTGTFVGSNGLIQSAAVNAARFDHTSAGVCRGLLIEESRTNLSSRSEEFNDVSWTKFGATISPNATTSPDGAMTADSIVENTSTSVHGTFRSIPTISGTIYTYSIFVKANGRNFALIYSDASGSSGRYVSIPADGTGVVLGNYNANNAIVSMQYLSDGWYRVSQVVTASTASTSIEIYPFINGTATSYLGDGTSGIHVWGAQLEAGSFATSYIPTTTAPLARSADVCSITGGDFNSFYNQPEGTVIVHGDSASGNGSRWCGTSPARAFELFGKTGLTYFESSGSTTNSIGAITLPTKFGLACKLNDFQGVRNGTLGGADTNATMPSPTTFNFGNLNAVDYLNGCIVSLRYYKKRLPNAKLAQLTV